MILQHYQSTVTACKLVAVTVRMQKIIAMQPLTFFK